MNKGQVIARGRLEFNKDSKRFFIRMGPTRNAPGLRLPIEHILATAVDKRIVIEIEGGEKE